MDNSKFATEELPVGAKNGCLTIIGGFEEYEREKAAEAKRKIEYYSQQKEEFLRTGKITSKKRGGGSAVFSGIVMDTDPVARIDQEIEKAKNWRNNSFYFPCYKVQCKCGMIQFVDHFHFAKKRHRYCDAIYDERKHRIGQDYCGLRLAQEEKQLNEAERVKDKNYDAVLPFTIHESLEILGYGQDKEISGSILQNRRWKPYFTIKRTYRCKCYLCGEEYSFCFEDFDIRNDEYGDMSWNGYYSRAYCKCHQISSFQWRTIDILRKHSIPYRVEVSFPDLLGTGGKNQLRYDFGLYSPEGNLYALLECQGEQHYKPVDEFGGEQQFGQQTKNDDLKRQYAMDHGVRLIEIPYKCNTYSKEESFLQSNGILH